MWAPSENYDVNHVILQKIKLRKMMRTLVNGLVNFWHLWGFFSRLHKTKSLSVNKADKKKRGFVLCSSPNNQNVEGFI